VTADQQGPTFQFASAEQLARERTTASAMAENGLTGDPLIAPE
jgi:hypothetical protein